MQISAIDHGNTIVVDFFSSRSPRDSGIRDIHGSLAVPGHHGAGADLEAATAPAVLRAPNGRRLLCFAFAFPSSGVPRAWAAGAGQDGVAFLHNMSSASLEYLGARIRAVRRPGDAVVVSLHWGGNWGYAVTAAQRSFAHRAIDDAGADIIFGHSSHHPKGMEVCRGRLIFYGCGDLLNDYEGIGGHDEFRPGLGILYRATLAPDSGELAALELVPLRTRYFRLHRASADDARWITERMNREGAQFNTRLVPGDDGRLRLQWRKNADMDAEPY